MQNKTFLKPTETGIKRTPGSYGFYTKNSDSSQIEIGKAERNVPVIAPGSGHTSAQMSKASPKRSVIKTTGGI